MSKTKLNCVLWMYARLTEKNFLRKEETVSALGISVMSFHRYLKFIRFFLQETAPEKTLKYRRRENVYWLSEKH
jgi:hypothetical protein